jgi:DNA primase
METIRDGRERTLLSSIEYTEEQVEAILNACGIDISTDTQKDFVVFCPFHGNRYSPSMTVSKTNGKFICHNGACSEMGSMEELIHGTLKLNPFQTRRLINKSARETTTTFAEKMEKAFQQRDKWEEFDQSKIDAMIDQFWQNESAVEYMHSRGFSDETLRRFQIGYSAKKNMLAVPMHNEHGLPVGVVGRPASHTNKRFRNSDRLPTSDTMFNMHRAKRSGAEALIVVEASFDAMSVDQAGYPNVAACLGGNFSEAHAQQIDKYFSTVIIMTDFDDRMKHRYENCRFCGTVKLVDCKGHNPGRKLGWKIANRMKDKRIRWASFESGLVYPHDAKDATDMVSQEIAQCIKNQVSSIEYQSWHLD